ncbi:hypothetical protein [Brucella intermedia]|uniref:hypothetical protein n=1 Tax=Brucella intermedia TaxID=94625 RepID=UPI0013B00AC8|nr:MULTISPECIES: hypothetical protein [Brucella/Ochrobactrum group]UXO85225.1 hypothetical protein N8I72_12595 [Brucella intermedia]
MMNVVRGFLLVSLVVLAAGCVSSGQKIEVSAAECALAGHGGTINEKCSAPKLGWKGANASDFTFSH